MNLKQTKKRIWAPLLAGAFLACTALPPPAQAAGLLIADGGFGGVLEIKEHDVHVTINNGVAVTRVTQIFHNTERRQVEALYTFPVPKGASVANFSMWINGKEMIGEVLEKEKARQIYDSYKKRRVDPGLLEQVDYKTFELRIFPIGPEADQKIEITYYQELDIDHDKGTYVYPLATVTRTDIDSRTTGRFAANIEVKSAVPITSLSSPSHADDFVVAKHTDAYYQASLETEGGSLSRDIVINYDMSRPRTGIDMITSNDKGSDGYFMMTIMAGEDLAKLDHGMDYVFLLDISGSMGNDRKLSISRNSITAFIDELGDQDRFEVMTFNVQPDGLFSELKPADSASKAQAATYLDTRQAKGGTILAPAMTTAYKYADPDRPLNVIILSDGMTKQNERRKLLELIRSRPENSRVFCIGIGNETNRPLLEQLAEDAGGLASFISRGDNFERQAKAFRRKLTHPVASDIELAFAGVDVYDIEPAILPNLYHGAPVRVYGRYKGDGELKVAMNANVRGREIKATAAMEAPARDLENPEIERMWALKRVDVLQKNADRSGSRDSVIDEIVQLGEEYSIVTEYTSFLVLENDNEYKNWKIDRRNQRRVGRDRAAQEALRKRLDELRENALANLGPVQTARDIPVTEQASIDASNPAPAQAPQRSRRSVNIDLGGGGGTGPIGPAFIALTLWLRKRKQLSV